MYLSSNIMLGYLDRLQGKVPQDDRCDYLDGYFARVREEQINEKIFSFHNDWLQEEKNKCT